VKPAKLSHAPSPAVLAGAFALTELLTAIAIAGVLVAIIIPTIGTTRKKARDVQCLANLRGLYSAITLYADDYQHYPTMNLENPADPSLSGPQNAATPYPWFTSLIRQGYLPVQTEKRDGKECQVAKALICPANTYKGQLYDWISAPKPWQGNYMTSRYYGGSGYSAQPVRVAEVTNPRAILLVDTPTTALGVWNDGDADWNNSRCRVAKNLHGGGAHALFIRGNIETITPATHPDLANERNWNPRYGN